MHVHHFTRMAACVAALALLAGCAPKSYSVRHPAPSEQLVFGTAAPATTLALVDARPGAGRAFSSGILPAALTVDGAPLDAAGYLASNLQAVIDNEPDVPGYPAKDTLFPFGFGLGY